MNAYKIDWDYYRRLKLLRNLSVLLRHIINYQSTLKIQLRNNNNARQGTEESADPTTRSQPSAQC